ncbi:MAG: STAS domain-containing protein [bacterium]
MKFSEIEMSRVPVFELTGKLMGGRESVDLSDRLKDLIVSGKKNIILDFSKVQWINSGGIGKILSWVMTLRREGGDIHFVGIKGKVDFYFKITKLYTVLKIYENKEEALEKI